MLRDMTEQILSYTPFTTPLKLDVMVNDRYRCTVKIEVVPGIEYLIRELKAFVRLQRPSLTNVDFELLPSGKPTFRN